MGTERFASYEAFLRSKDSLWRFGMKAALADAIAAGDFEQVNPADVPDNVETHVYRLKDETYDFGADFNDERVDAYIYLRYRRAAAKHGVNPSGPEYGAADTSEDSD